MQIGTVRTNLASVIQSYYTAQSSPIPLTVHSHVPDDGTAPFAYVQLESIVYDRAMSGGSVEAVFTVMVMLSRADDLTAQRQMDTIVSDTGVSSIRAAIAASHTLLGACDFAHCVGTDGPPRWFDWREGVKYHGVGLRVRVLGTMG